MLLPLVFCGNLEYYALILGNEVALDQHEHFIKQTYRNRCTIAGPNKVQDLIIPVHAPNHTPMHEVKVDYSEDWPTRHWRSLEAAYAAAPFFEHYQDRFRSSLTIQHDSLCQLNLAMHSAISQILQLPEPTLTQEFQPYSENDHRLTLSPKQASNFTHPSYPQVFEERHGFLPNLSILDLIFNEGPAARQVLQHGKWKMEKG